MKDAGHILRVNVAERRGRKSHHPTPLVPQFEPRPPIRPAYQEKRKNLFEYLNKEYRIAVNRMAPDDVFLLFINPPSKNKPVQKLIAKYVFDCYEKRRSLVL